MAADNKQINIQNHGYPEFPPPSICVASVQRPTLYKSFRITILNQLCPNSIACALNLCAPPSAEVYRQAQDTKPINTKQ